MLVVTGEATGVDVVCVLVIAAGVLLPSAVALTVRVTPTLLQICWAKDRTSGKREFLSVSAYFWKRAYYAAFVAIIAPVPYLWTSKIGLEKQC